jgi:hypothetical protein
VTELTDNTCLRNLGTNQGTAQNQMAIKSGEGRRNVPKGEAIFLNFVKKYIQYFDEN